MLWAKTGTEILHSPPWVFLFICASPPKSQIYRLCTTGFPSSNNFSHTALNLSLLSQSNFRTTDANGYKGHFQFQFLYFRRIMWLKRAIHNFPNTSSSGNSQNTILHSRTGSIIVEIHTTLIHSYILRGSDTHRLMTWAKLIKSLQQQHSSGLWTLMTWLLCMLSFPIFYLFFFFILSLKHSMPYLHCVCHEFIEY